MSDPLPYAEELRHRRHNEITWSGGNPFLPGDVLGRGDRFFFLSRCHPANAEWPARWWFEGVWDNGSTARFKWPDGLGVWRLVRSVGMATLFGGHA